MPARAGAPEIVTGPLFTAAPVRAIECRGDRRADRSAFVAATSCMRPATGSVIVGGRVA